MSKIIKFSIKNCENVDSIDKCDFDTLEYYRTILYKYKAIGFNKKNGLGYGNISKRLTGNSFVITGSQTGNLANLTGKHYCIIKKCYFDENAVDCSGNISPSSESLTHGAFYYANKNINAVLHIHNHLLWKILNNNKDITKTPIDTQYGSKELFSFILTKAKDNGDTLMTIVLNAHFEEGIIFAGSSIEEVTNFYLSLL